VAFAEEKILSLFVFTQQGIRFPQQGLIVVSLILFFAVLLAAVFAIRIFGWPKDWQYCTRSAEEILHLAAGPFIQLGP
jgi:hypothetical protein